MLFFFNLQLISTISKPNILLILLDDFGWNDVEYHNSALNITDAWTHTPNLNEFARSGVRLEQYYTSPICSPARASLLTGRYTIRTGIQHSCYSAQQGTGLPLSERTIAQALKDVGYDTWMFGKWHLGFNSSDHIPTARGFDYHYGHYTADVEAFNHTFSKPYPLGLDWHRSNHTYNEVPDGPTEHNHFTAHLLVNDLARKMSHRNTTETKSPLFVYFPFHMVHEGLKLLEAPFEYINRFKNITDVNRRTFVAMVSVVDEAVGNITKLFQKYKLADNLITFIASDNGSPPDKRGKVGNLPLRGFKHQLYEGGIKVPAMISGGELPVNTQSYALLAHVDIFPTLVSLAGGILNDTNPLDGYDMWDTLVKGIPSPRIELLHNFDTSSNPTAGFKGALRNGSYKIIKFAAHHTFELYNIVNDPNEEKNLSQDPSYAAILKDMKSRLLYFRDAAVPCWGNPTNFSGDCEKNPPKMNCTTPSVWQPDWCLGA